MDALLTAIVLWLSLNFNLPATDQHPRIDIVPAMEIVFRRYGALTPEARLDVSSRYVSAHSSSEGREVLAVYDQATKTILLPEGWTGRTPAELSVLVHELVHHLQNSADLIHECPAAHEDLAYAAQEKRLGLFGLSLASEFELDGFTLKMTSSCAF